MEVKPPEKKTKKPSFSSLPDEILENCLARISKSYYPKLSSVSKSFRSLLTSKELYAARARLGNTEACLYVCLLDCISNIPQWFTLWINPNQTLMEKETTAQLLVPIQSSNINTSPYATVVGSEVYVIGGSVQQASSTVRVLDCRSNTWRDAPSLNEARTPVSAKCVYGEKIYVMGGDSLFGEVFDIKTQTWERLPDPCSAIREFYVTKFSEVEGKIYIRNRKTDYVYDLNQGKWECWNGKFAKELRSECVMENVSYGYDNILTGRSRLCWFDIKDGNWKEVKGIDTLDEYWRNIDSLRSWPILVSFNGKLLAVWEECTRDPTLSDAIKIWCAEIVVEKRDGCEIWGKFTWVDVVHTGPFTCPLLNCVAVLL